MHSGVSNISTNDNWNINSSVGASEESKFYDGSFSDVESKNTIDRLVLLPGHERD